MYTFDWMALTPSYGFGCIWPRRQGRSLDTLDDVWFKWFRRYDTRLALWRSVMKLEFDAAIRVWLSELSMLKNGAGTNINYYRFVYALHVGAYLIFWLKCTCKFSLSSRVIFIIKKSWLIMTKCGDFPWLSTLIYLARKLNNSINPTYYAHQIRYLKHLLMYRCIHLSSVRLKEHLITAIFTGLGFGGLGLG